MQHVMISSLVVVMSVYIIVLTPSVSMVCLLLCAGLAASILFVLYKMKMGALILCLVVIGGLFVLLSFVVLSMPWDYSKVWEKKDIGVVVLSSFGGYFWPYSGGGSGEWGGEWMVSEKYCVVFISLIFFLLISLGMFYSLIKVSKGTSFGKF
nr:NADH dehydrogenase subunit 6 [Penenirmus auritus]